MRQHSTTIFTSLIIFTFILFIGILFSGVDANSTRQCIEILDLPQDLADTF